MVLVGGRGRSGGWDGGNSIVLERIIQILSEQISENIRKESTTHREAIRYVPHVRTRTHRLGQTDRQKESKNIYESSEGQRRSGGKRMKERNVNN